jgi:ATP-dependent DNA helicase RecQ
VVSPLISLMKDQVSALKAAGVDAAYINSSLSAAQLRLVYDRCRGGAYKIVYIAPERLEGDRFASLALSLGISLVAVDEAHCISQWGQDFRPSYLKITDFIKALPQRPVVAAFTATATSEVRRDIIRLLELRDPVCEVTGFDRPNLYFDVQHPKNKMAALLTLIRQRSGKCGIIYCATRSSVERICAALCAGGIPATRYHAGLDDGERRRNQEDFQFDRKTVMVATNAFGMGIDKSNVSFVIHYNMPKSLEAYYQEAGRAGRDGEPSDCILLFSAGDIATAKFLIENSGSGEIPEEEQAAIRRRDYERLRIMTDYCKTSQCLRGYILDYFGQSHGELCGSCGNCKGEFSAEDITIPAQMILSCVIRVHEHLGYYVGKNLIIRILRGSGEQRIKDLGLDSLSTCGLMGKLSAERIHSFIDLLEAENCLITNPAHSTLEPAENAHEVLFGGKKVTMRTRRDRSDDLPRGRRRRKAAAAPQGEDGLLAALKATRARLAHIGNVPPYIVFSNAALSDMAAKAPHTMTEFLDVSGVGEVKAARYGKAFLKAIADYEENGPQ